MPAMLLAPAIHASPVDNGSLHWTAPAAGSVNDLGTVTQATGDRGAVTLLHPKISAKGGSLVCTETSWNPSGTQLTIAYDLGGATVHVTVRITTTGTGMEAQLEADQPVIASVDMGSWPADLKPQSIAVPYYTANIWYVQELSEFANSWWDWHTTQATALKGTAAQYSSKTDGMLNLLHERMVVAVSADVDAVLPSPGNPASPYKAALAGRLVLDIWDMDFSKIRRALAELGDYGIGDCAGIVHNWQHAGYDNALPEHYPANPALGGDIALLTAIAQGKQNGCLMAVHENYIDYYPNYPKFNAEAVALNSDGTRMNAWLKKQEIPHQRGAASVTSYVPPSGWHLLADKPGWMGLQSYATKPGWMIKNAGTQSLLIHQAYETNADYLDVHSAAPISSHGDMDAATPGAGMLTTWTSANQALFEYERKVHGGPVFGEGLDHWYYSGLLDGVEAQLGAGSVPANSDAALPLFVDFDLLRIHPLQVNHGMGYYGRWMKKGSSTMTPAQTDAYRMQEIAFGHAPFLGSGAWNDIPQAFVESNLIAPVAASYGAAQAASIHYQANGTWVSPSVAARSGQFAQVEVNYNNGLTVVANSATTKLPWDNLVLPPYGWAAKGPNLLAYTALCGGTVCDYAETPSSIFANARNQRDLEGGSSLAAPSATNVQAGEGNTLSMTIVWDVYRAPGPQSRYKSFVHFVNDAQASSSNAGIVFQDDHWPTTRTSEWSAGQSIMDGPLTVRIPHETPDGTYSVRVGLFDPATQERIKLHGNDDGTHRYVIGSLTISGGGSQVWFTPSSALADEPRLNATGMVVNFGSVQTDGMFSLKQEKEQWILRPFPRSRNFTVLLSSARFPTPASVQSAGASSPTIIPISKGAFWQLPLDGSKSYSWPAK